ncbi:TetR family transcriptional regulator [Iodidimonas gelatinilytica]|uniref:TetR family transcriptional regulator n=1 Tax=Iodidimonas gelatinilytica TaxID=1236966 RepID=A0A5A7MVM6_9PROT|nr:TetR family transcriptional regulator C-terminal domain-containing protein [Iodidimonas gelatinilytica]GER00053.1 TetR family transcriptional regulator [Iodidimonas gelatinilytica]
MDHDIQMVRPQNGADEAGKTRIQARNEKRILDAAQEVFAAYGFHGATIEKVAEKADMSKPNLHYYFKRKTDLYVAVLRRTLETWLTPLAHLDPEGDPEEELSRYIRFKVEMSRRSPIASRVFANEVLQGAPFLKEYMETDLRELVESKSGVICGWIKQGKLLPVDPYHLIFLIWAATQHYADFQPQIKAVMNMPRLTKDYFADVSDSLIRIILRGVLADKPESAKMPAETPNS